MRLALSSDFRSILLCFIAMLWIGCSDDAELPLDAEAQEMNQLPLGMAAIDLLSNEQYTRLTLEVAYEEGHRPSAATLSALKSFLEARLHKPDGIFIEERLIEVSAEQPYDLNTIVAIEEVERTRYNQDETLSVWIFFAGAHAAADQDNTVLLGTAYRNTSMVLYGETMAQVQSANAATLTLPVLETITLEHEFGHLLGLVNVGTPAIRDHEDADYPKHCRETSCLMYFETVSNVLRIRDLSELPTFDAFCLEDLRAQGGK